MRFDGTWTIEEDAFHRDYGLSLAELPLSTVHPKVRQVLGGPETVDDFSALDDTGEPYLRIVPFNTSGDEISPVACDGDIAVCVHEHLDANARGPIQVLKQRGWHAELCYKDEGGTARFTAPYHQPMRDRPCHQLGLVPDEMKWILHVFRLELPGVASDRVQRLRKNVRIWRQIFGRYDFADKKGPYASPDMWYLDPAGFSSVMELEDVARRLIDRNPDLTPVISPITCVQWVHQVLCLALVLPVTNDILSRLRIEEAYQRSWQGVAGLPEESLPGLEVIPLIPYSPAQVLQSYLDVYVEKASLIKILREEPELVGFLADLVKQSKNPLLAKAGERVDDYLREVAANEDLSMPFVVDGEAQRFVLPATFFCESRKKPSVDGRPYVRYVCTAVNSKYVVPKSL